MSALGGPAQAGLAGAAGSQDHVGQARAKKDKKEAEASRRFEDALDLRVNGVEGPEAIHALEEEEHPDQDRRKQPEDQKPARSSDTGDDDQSEEGLGGRIDITG